MIHGDVLGERARLTPERTALVLAGSRERFSYAELDARAARCGRVLREALALSKGDRFVRELRALLPGALASVALDEGRRASPKDASYEELLAAAPPAAAARERCAPEDLYALLYTSGTTGRPKGVMIPHRMVAWNGYNTAVCWQLREDDVSPVFTPLYHAGGLFAFLVPILTAGGTIVLHARFDPRR